jgi:hypothetical protein
MTAVWKPRTRDFYSRQLDGIAVGKTTPKSTITLCRRIWFSEELIPLTTNRKNLPNANEIRRSRQCSLTGFGSFLEGLVPTNSSQENLPNTNEILRFRQCSLAGLGSRRSPDHQLINSKRRQFTIHQRDTTSSSMLFHWTAPPHSSNRYGKSQICDITNNWRNSQCLLASIGHNSIALSDTTSAIASYPPDKLPPTSACGSSAPPHPSWCLSGTLGLLIAAFRPPAL